MASCNFLLVNTRYCFFKQILIEMCPQFHVLSENNLNHPRSCKQFPLKCLTFFFVKDFIELRNNKSINLTKLVLFPFLQFPLVTN